MRTVSRSRRSFERIAMATAAALLFGCSGSSDSGTAAQLPRGSSGPTPFASAPGLLAGYGFGEGAGSITADASGNGITGTLNSAVWAAGKNGGGLSFNGTTSYVDLGNPALLALTGSMTVSAWVNENANVADDGIIIARSNGGGFELKSSPDTGVRTFAFAVYTTSGAYVARYSVTVRALNTWYHVAGVYDAAARGLHVYVNGVLDDGTLLGTVPSTISAPVTNTTIGQRAAGFNIKGALDDVRVYGRALSQVEIQSDTSAPVAGSADTTPPSIPGGLAAAAVSPFRIDLSWRTSTDDVGVAGYRIFRSGSAIGTSTTLSWSDTAVAPSTTYSYAVSAFDAAGNESQPSAPASATTPAAPPDTVPPAVSLTAPANGALVAGNAVAVNASASDNAGVAGVLFLLDGANLGAEDTAAPYSISWNTTAVTSGPHLLSARARDAAGNVTTSASVNVTVDNDPPAGSVLINSGASATSSTAATLSLFATDALSAVIAMRLSSNGTTFSAAEPYATTRAWTLSTGDGTKTVYVQFQDAAGNWSSSFSDGIVLDTVAPAISAVASSNISGSGATITWTTNEPATSQVEYGLTNKLGSLTARDSSLVTSHRVLLSGLSRRTRYDYRVRSKDAAANEGLGKILTVTTTDTVDTTPPTVPTGLSAHAVSSGQIDLLWSASTDNVGVTGYAVFRNGAQVGSTPVGSDSDTGLLANTTYAYTVAAYDAAGNGSAQSAQVTATTLAAGAPGDIVALPMPLIGRFAGVNAFADNDLDGTLIDFGANRARDDVYDGWGHYWRNLNLPYPAWVAYDLSAVPVQQRGPVLVAFYNESDGYDNGPSSFTPLSYNEPQDYFIEGNAAPGSTSGAPSSGWVTLLAVSGNTHHSRSHLMDLTGYQWIRFRATRGSSTNQSGNTDCELKLEIYDVHQGNTDSWAFLGDSITNGAMNHLEHGDLNFAQRVNASVPSNFPMYENAGIPFDDAQQYGALRLSALLANSAARYIAISYGMNDAGAGLATDYSFYNAYKGLVDTVLAAGRIPVIPTISWTAQQPWQSAIGDPVTGPQFGLNRQLAKLKADYRAQGKVIVDGPDLWHFFQANPSLIGEGDIHPTAAGYVAMRSQWAQAMIAAVYPH